jgi:uncharacterized protein (DUF4415 family)
MSAKSHATTKKWVDPDDAPELTDSFFIEADEFNGDTLVRRGRPAGTGAKKSTTVRFDNDILTAFKAAGRGWQTRMNNALRDWLREHKPA